MFGVPQNTYLLTRYDWMSRVDVGIVAMQIQVWKDSKWVITPIYPIYK